MITCFCGYTVMDTDQDLMDDHEEFRHNSEEEEQIKASLSEATTR